MMESKHQQQAINNSIQITSVTLAMEGQSMESGIPTGTSPREVSISTGAHPTDELEWHHRFKYENMILYMKFILLFTEWLRFTVNHIVVEGFCVMNMI